MEKRNLAALDLLLATSSLRVNKHSFPAELSPIENLANFDACAVRAR